MQKTEFLQELKEALEGEVSVGVIQENVGYYHNYISQEAAKGRTEDEIIEELGGPRIIARTIMDSSEAAGESGGSSGTRYSENTARNDNDAPRSAMNSHYMDLSKWYWKFLLVAVLIVVLVLVFTLVGGIFSLFFRFAGPIMLIWLVFTFFRGMRR